MPYASPACRTRYIYRKSSLHLQSDIYLTGSDQFPRIKLGVGQKPHPDYDLADWVLSRFSQGDLKELDQALDHACAAAELIVRGDIDRAMNQYN